MVRRLPTGDRVVALTLDAAMLSSTAGSIILGHMNRPSGGTAEGVEAAVPKLRQRGFGFVNLSDYLR